MTATTTTSQWSPGWPNKDNSWTWQARGWRELVDKERFRTIWHLNLFVILEIESLVVGQFGENRISTGHVSVAIQWRASNKIDIVNGLWGKCFVLWSVLDFQASSSIRTLKLFPQQSCELSSVKRNSLIFLKDKVFTEDNFWISTGSFLKTSMKHCFEFTSKNFRKFSRKILLEINGKLCLIFLTYFFYSRCDNPPILWEIVMNYHIMNSFVFVRKTLLNLERNFDNFPRYNFTKQE